MSALSVSLRSDVHARAPAEQSSADLAADWSYRVARWLDKITPTDVLDELCGHEDELQRLMVLGDAKAIGTLVLSVRNQYAEALARRD